MENKRTEFGRAMLETHFPHVARTGVTMLNNGSFGIAPKCVLDSKMRLVDEFERFADEFVRLRQVGLNSASLSCLAHRLGVHPAQCALIDNVTLGMSNMLSHLLQGTPDDSCVLVNTWTYGCVKFAAAKVVAERGGRGEVREAEFRLPLTSGQELLDAVADQLDKCPKIRVAIFDHITSTTACVMPVKQMTALCHSRGVKAIIDGAHAIGQIRDLNIDDIGADCYIGNLNKWHFMPKSVALMWVSEALAEGTKPAAATWLMHDLELSVRYSYMGTRDTSSFFVIEDAMRFVDEVCGGLDNVHSYCTKLADEATLRLTKVWGTDRLPLPESMQAPFMRLIRLPDHLQQPEVKESMTEFRFSSQLWRYLAYKLKMDLLILDIEGTLYIRVSAAIIVCEEDIRKLGDTVMKLSKADIRKEF